MLPDASYDPAMPELVIPSPRWAVGYREALREAAEIGDAVPWDPEFDCTAEALNAHIDAMGRGIWGPGSTQPTQLLCWWVDGDDYLARISLRFPEIRADNPTFYSGHGDIGYDVRPSARGRGIATAMLKAMLETARERGYPDVLITCDIANEASRRVLEKAGGSLLDEYDDNGELVFRYQFNWS